jgi:hypothetical protein
MGQDLGWVHLGREHSVSGSSLCSVLLTAQLAL